MKARSLTKLTLVVVLVVAAVLLGGYYAIQWRAQRAVEDALARLPDGIAGTAGRTHYDIFGRALTVDNLALVRGGQPWLDVAQIVLVQPNGRGTPSDPWQAEALALNGIVGRAPDAPQRVSRVVARDLLAYADPAGGTPLAALTGLRVLKAASIEVSDLASAEGVLGKLQLQGITDGKVAALSASGITIQDGAEAATRIASADAADLDLDGLVALLGQGSEKGGEVRRLLAGNIVLRDIATGKSGDQGDHVGSIELKGWQASTALPTCSDDEGCFAAALARMAVEALVVTDMDLQSTDDEHDAADGQVQLGRLALERFDAGKIGLFDMTDSGFVSNVDGSSFGIRHLKTENADLSALLQAQSADHASNDVERDLRQVRISNALLEDFSYRGTPDGLPFTIARIEASNNYGADDAVQTRLAVRHLIVPMPTSEQPQIMDLPPMAAAIIGAQADLAVDLDYSFEPSKQALDIERLRVALNDAGALTLKTRLEGLDMSDDTGGLVDNPVMDGLTLLQRARLTDAVLRFDNQTLVDRIIERAAADNGIKPDEVRLGIRQQLPVLAQLMPWQTDVVDQMEAFLAKPQVLTLTLRPSQPVTLIDLAAGVMSGGLDELQPTLKAN